MRLSSEYRADARRALAGRWGICVAVTLVAAILGAGVFFGVGITIDFSNTSESVINGSINVAYLLERLGVDDMYYAWQSTLSGIVSMLGLVQFVIGGAALLGLNLFYIGLYRGAEPKFDTLFSRFDIFGKALGLRLLMGIFIFLWSMLFVIPGIVAAYRYRMAPYLMAEHPGMGIRDAINESKRLTMGHKGRWFCLDLSFIGWHLLCALTLGIGYLWLSPYITAASAAFYLDLTGSGAPNGAGQADSGPEFVYNGPERL